jgi:hypothetical protein
MRRSRKFLLPVLAVAALAAVGAASTNAIVDSGTPADANLGYVSITDSGATLSDVAYTTSDDNSLTGVTLTFASALATNDTVSIATNGGTGSGGVDGTCTGNTGFTVYTCTFGADPAVDGVTSLGVTVAPQ